MKICLLGRALALVFLTATLLAGPRDAQWQEVDDAIKKGLPKTAIERLEPILIQSLADKAYAEATKAMSRKIALEGEIQGNRAEERIVRLQAELEKAPAEMKPVLEAILAHGYWQYFQQNRWRFLQRTQTAATPGSDLQTWDLPRILGEIDQHFTVALADEATLKATPIRDYDELLNRGKAPDDYRPTLFDFLAYEALQFYQAGEQAATEAEDSFEISADSPIFDDAVEFMNWRPETSDPQSPKVKAIGLYQALLTFHQSDGDRAAFYDADLARLTFGHNVAAGETKEGRFTAALQRFIDATSKHEISSRALAELAAQFNLDGDAARAHALAQRGYTAFPQSAGGAQCINLIHQIEARLTQLETEQVWNAPWPTLNVTYRNVSKIYFRAVAVDFVQSLSRRQWRLGVVDEGRLEELLGSKPALEWEADVPATADYKERTEKLPSPTSLKPGYYFIVASHDRNFGKDDNQVSVAAVWVSDLALIVQMRQDGAASQGFVLKAASGEPVAGATVRFWQHDPNGLLVPIAPTKTDENGRFRFMAKEQAVVVLADYGGQAISSKGDIYLFGKNNVGERTSSRTVFFTDRAIYRPGQTINYKGVSVRFNQQTGNYSVQTGLTLTVVFNDPNGQEIARATHKTNDYGSFSGVFTAPRDRLMGLMTLQVLSEPSMTSLSVEEYKRPKFQVELNAPTEAAQLGVPVDLVGKATAYTGAAIGGAKVKWRVERRVQLPYWCWWRQTPASKAIAHGTALTGTDGTFTLQFTAEPDRTVPAKNEPIFLFALHADVTDTSGETRSTDRVVQAGYTALQARLTADEWQTSEKPVEFILSTHSLDGDPQPAKGKITLSTLRQPPSVVRQPLQNERFLWSMRDEDPKPDPTRPDSWEQDAVVIEKPFETDPAGKAQLALPLQVGIYRATLETTDRFGKIVTARQTVQVVNPRDRHFTVKIPNQFSAPVWSVEPGKTFTALWGTGYETGRAFVELECNGKSLKSYWTAPDRTQELIEQTATEEMRGGFTVRVTYVRENRAYVNQRIVDVPWSNQQLSVKWESFRSKLTPGEKETWTAVVTGPDAKRAAAEMVASLYDASLDQYQPHQWPQTFNVFRNEFSAVVSDFQNAPLDFQTLRSWKSPELRDERWTYRSFPPEVFPTNAGSDGVVYLSKFEARGAGAGRSAAATSLAGARMQADLTDNIVSAPALARRELAENSNAADTQLAQGAAPLKPDLTKVTARKNLNETAFFFPQLTAGNDGVVKLIFTMPEALTEWNFIGFTHDKKLRSGFITSKVVTAKDLMVEPNAPRFVREGDAIEFSVKVSNQTKTPQSGTVKLTFADANSQKSVDDMLANRTLEQNFEVPARQSRSYSWRIQVPDGTGFLAYRAVAATAKFSDGEEGFLPVLSRRIQVTESLPLPIRGKTTKQFTFKNLLDSGASETLRHQSLTVQMVSQPAWYAVMALPYLMEYPYECSEQVFNRLYANVLARHLAHSDPKIRRIFELWKNTPALDSPLEKNQDLKSVMLEETPWLRDAKTENQARKNVGLLFDANRLDAETVQVMKQLSDRQQSDGLWPWFPGGRSSEYISLYIMTGFGRLRHLGVEIDLQPALRSLAALDAWIDERYRRVLKSPNPEAYVPSDIDALYLYGRSFFLDDKPIAEPQREAMNFFLRQSGKFWLEVRSRQTQAHLALALQRFGDKQAPLAIMKSIKERSVTDDELGRYWRDSELSWWWYHAPIETQAMMIEAFAEISDDAQAVEECKVWLLKQKQTQDWRTTKATADAVYALLLRGKNLLSSDALVEVSLGGQPIKPEQVEAGTGFTEQKFERNEIKPSMGQITVKKVDEGISWGSVHWQYLEDVAKITPHEGTPLKLKKTLFIKDTTNKGQVLKAISGPLSVGDELVVRIELRVDRDMEFVHLKDQRGSGTEPVNVLSQYKYQDGLAYYESTRDTATHFFIDYLPKGAYVFEYSTRVQLKGNYQTGLAEIQCMYAPEFNSHSESTALEVK